jgi:glycosyltransferase involved in cell wall biosynthesis
LCCFKLIFLQSILKEVINVKALFFLNSFVGGGAERVCLNLAKELYKLNIESDFITVYSSKADYDIPHYIHTYCIGIAESSSVLGIFLDIVKSIPRVNAYISDKTYLLITAHLPVAQIVASLTTAGKRCLYVMHVTQHLVDKSSSGLYRMCLRFLLKKKRIITVSKGLENELRYEYGLRAGQIKTIYNPCGVICPEDESNMTFSYERPYIVVMGRLEEQKNPELALELYQRGKFYEEYDLVYLGKGSLAEKLKKKIDDLAFQDYVFLKGFQRKPIKWLVNASLLLSCSRQEGLPLNLVEALICGTPVVASDCPYGPNEILTGELSAYLISPEEDPDASVAVMWSALKKYPRITERYYSKFDGQLIVKEYLRTWEKYFVKD